MVGGLNNPSHCVFLMKKILILPKKRFDELMKRNGWNDANIPDNAAFISICCNQIIKENYLKKIRKIDDEHWFKYNHKNVLNIEFDDIHCETKDTPYGMAYGLTETDATRIADFVKANQDKENFYIHCMAGKSRSVGVGMAISNFYFVPMTCCQGTEERNEYVMLKVKEKLCLV